MTAAPGVRGRRRRSGRSSGGGLLAWVGVRAAGRDYWTLDGRVRTSAVTPAARPISPAPRPIQPAADPPSLDVPAAAAGAAEGAVVVAAAGTAAPWASASLAVVTKEGAGCPGSAWPSTVFSSHFTTVPSV